MDDTNDFLIPGLNFLSLEDRPPRYPTTPTPQRHTPDSPQSINDQSVPRPKRSEIQFPLSPPPTNSQPKRSVPLPIFQASPDKPPTNMPFGTHFGGVLDSPIIYKHVGLNAHSLISPPPTLPTTTRTLPPTDSPYLRVIPEHEDFLTHSEECHDDHDNRRHEHDEFRPPSLLGLSSPLSHLNGSMNLPSSSSQPNPLLSPISPDWSTTRMPSDTSSPSFPYCGENEASGSSSILLQHRPGAISFARGSERSSESYHARPLSPAMSPLYSRPILPPLDMSSLLDTPPPPSSYELSDDPSPPSPPPDTALTPGHPFIRDHTTHFADGHDPRRPYAQNGKLVSLNPRTSSPSSVLSSFGNYGYDSKPLGVFDARAHHGEEDESDMDVDQHPQLELLATLEPPSPKPLPLDPLLPSLLDYAHEFTSEEIPWSPSLRGFSDLPDLYEDTCSKSSGSHFMDIDHLTESPKTSVLALPGADTDDDLIPLDDTPVASGSGIWETASREELDSGPFLGGSTSSGSGGSSIHPYCIPRSSSYPVSSARQRQPRSAFSASPASMYDLHTSTPAPSSSSSHSHSQSHPRTTRTRTRTRPNNPPSRRRSLLLVDDEDDEMDDADGDGESESESESDDDDGFSAELHLRRRRCRPRLRPRWGSALTGGGRQEREDEEEEACIWLADGSGSGSGGDDDGDDDELRRLAGLMRMALGAEREAREEETRVLSGSGGGVWPFCGTTSGGGSEMGAATIMRGGAGGIDVAARREARKAKKKARDRAREIGSMMRLKMAERGSGSSSSTGAAAAAAAAAGKDASSSSSRSSSADESSPEAITSDTAGKKKRKGGTLGEARSMDQLVAKMMLRRHDTYRTLVNRKTPLAPGRKYRSSPLVVATPLPDQEMETGSDPGLTDGSKEANIWTLHQDY